MKRWNGIFARHESGRAVIRPGASNAALYGSGKLGKGLKLTGRGATVEAGHEIAFDVTNAFSFGCWTKFKDKGGAHLKQDG